MNKETDIIIRTPVGNTENIHFKEMGEQDAIFGPIMCCVETSTVNSIGKELKYRYGKTNIGIPVFMGDIATAGKAEHIRKGINKRARIEKEKKISFGLKKTKYMIVKTGREGEVILLYLGTTISTDRQLKEHKITKH